MERKIVVKKMMNWFNILNDIDNLVLDKKFNVVVNNDVIIIKKNTHHKFTKYINVDISNFYNNKFNPILMDMVYIPKGDKYYKINNMILPSISLINLIKMRCYSKTKINKFIIKF